MAGGGEEEDRRGEEGVKGGGEEGERGGGEAVEFGGVEEGRRGERRPLRQLLGDGSAHSGCTMYRHTRREISVLKKGEREGGREGESTITFEARVDDCDDRPAEVAEGRAPEREGQEHVRQVLRSIH